VLDDELQVTLHGYTKNLEEVLQRTSKIGILYFAIHGKAWAPHNISCALESYYHHTLSTLGYLCSSLSKIKANIYYWTSDLFSYSK